jgi:hypothetical protein
VRYIAGNKAIALRAAQGTLAARATGPQGKAMTDDLAGTVSRRMLMREIGRAHV